MSNQPDDAERLDGAQSRSRRGDDVNAGGPSAVPPSHTSPANTSSANMRTPSEANAPESRAARLARIKAEIDAGTYDTDEKLEQALSRMFDKTLRDQDS